MLYIKPLINQAAMTTSYVIGLIFWLKNGRKPARKAEIVHVVADEDNKLKIDTKFRTKITDCLEPMN